MQQPIVNIVDGSSNESIFPSLASICKFFIAKRQVKLTTLPSSLKDEIRLYEKIMLERWAKRGKKQMQQLESVVYHGATAGSFDLILYLYTYERCEFLRHKHCALKQAIAGGHLELVRFLITDCKINPEDDAVGALYAALAGGVEKSAKFYTNREALVRYLVSCGLSRKYLSRNMIFCWNIADRTDENLRLAKYLYARAGDAPEMRTFDQHTLEHRLRDKDLPAAKWLLEIMLPHTRIYWSSLLHAAVQSGNLETVNLLLSFDECPQTMLLEENLICTVAQQHNTAIADLLLEAVRTKTRIDNGNAPTVAASQERQRGRWSHQSEAIPPRVCRCSDYLLEMVLVHGNSVLMHFLVDERRLSLNEDMIRSHFRSPEIYLDYLLKHFAPGVTAGIVESAFRSGDEAKISAVEPYIARNSSLLTTKTLNAIGYARNATAREYSNWWKHYEYNAYPGVPWESGEVLRKRLEAQQQVVGRLQSLLRHHLPPITDEDVLDGLERATSVVTEHKRG